MNLRLFLASVAILSLVLLIPKSESKIVQGHLSTDKRWYFLTSFCPKGNQVSGFSYNFLYPVAYGTEKILLYPDDTWSQTKDTNKNCNEKVAAANPLNNQVIALNTSYTLTSRYSGCSIVRRNGESYYNCTGSRDIRGLSNCWYIAVARCSPADGNVSGLQLTYNLDVPSMVSTAAREKISTSLVIFALLETWLISDWTSAF